jgi:IS5 family transposase
MGQFGFFDVDRRLGAITAKGDPLEMIARVVPFESFRAEIEAAVLTPVSEKKSSAGRKPIDVMVMFRMLVLQSLYNLSDEQVEYQVRDRLSFTRFLRLGIEDSIPDGTTLWLFREALTKAGLIEKLFARFGQHLEAKGYIARGGQMVDATIVPVPKQRNGRDENEDVKAGKTPEAWQKNPAKNRQKDKDARWTKKHGKSFYGYKNHVNADAKHKLIRQYDVTDASVHDSQTFDGLVNRPTRPRMYMRTARIVRRRLRRSSACAACVAASISARAAIIRSRRRRRTRTARRARFGPASSTCSVLNRTRRAAGSCGRSASRGRKPKSDCRTLLTTSAGL